MLMFIVKIIFYITIIFLALMGLMNLKNKFAVKKEKYTDSEDDIGDKQSIDKDSKHNRHTSDEDENIDNNTIESTNKTNRFMDKIETTLENNTIKKKTLVTYFDNLKKNVNDKMTEINLKFQEFSNVLDKFEVDSLYDYEQEELHKMQSNVDVEDEMLNIKVNDEDSIEVEDEIIHVTKKQPTSSTTRKIKSSENTSKYKKVSLPMPPYGKNNKIDEVSLKNSRKVDVKTLNEYTEDDDDNNEVDGNFDNLDEDLHESFIDNDTFSCNYNGVTSSSCLNCQYI